jgi:hypothetical protein
MTCTLLGCVAPCFLSCSLGIDTDLLRGEALKRLKGDAEEASPKRKKSVRGWRGSNSSLHISRHGSSRLQPVEQQVPAAASPLLLT